MRALADVLRINWADVVALILTLKLAAVTTGLLLLIGLPVAWWLARTRWRGRFLIEAIVALPLVLPPTVLGFYLLLLLGPHGPVGTALAAMGLAPIVFSFPGLVVGSIFYSLPFAVQPLQQAFERTGEGLLEAAATLRAGPWDAFFSVVLPLARRGILTAAVLSFAHTLGEFGVILMIGGNIPDQTRVASIAIYSHVEAMEYASAHTLAAVLTISAALMLVLVFLLNRRFAPLQRDFH